MVDEAIGSKPKAIRQKGKLLASVIAVLLVAVLVTAFVLSSAGKAPENENEDNSVTSDEVDEDTLVSGVASEFILNQSDMGTDWDITRYSTNISEVVGVPSNPAVTSAASISFSQNDSTDRLHYRIDVAVIVFNSTVNATAFYNERTEIHPQDDSDINPEYRPSYPVLLSNVSIGDGGSIIDWPHITVGHEAKLMIFVHKNVVCGFSYHDVTSYNPLPNDLLIELANKMEAKIVD
jgi:hypothetical protein